MLKFLHEDDRDFLLDPKQEFNEEALATEMPIKPQHAPRSLMVTVTSRPSKSTRSRRIRAHSTPPNPARAAPIRRSDDTMAANVCRTVLPLPLSP